MEQHVILVNGKDEPQGLCEKVKAHQDGLLHRAVSIHITCGDHILIQKRAHGKYHSGGLWANAACSHPLTHETVEQAALRTLETELSLVIPLTYKGYFIYKEPVSNHLIEHELDHVFHGIVEQMIEVHPHLDEVADIKWVEATYLKDWMASSPQEFAPWFPLVLEFLNQKGVIL